ncbi:signal peptide peptidase SppA [Calditerrivibrio nitroreducens]|uniref:Signal peptide peptidase SppA, 36K type n=1 Tax=Calditerrivibrio nitroreducens (strain DSM 19672 / NBRC 101217 / Yu37-1) TaxID=768670 RepID=E4TJ85_CALNY|nr:signal peptide peptidase SppA [Calditerrivibrio nitroreducens]ADR18121.1 signal peptide peptidase SppA, 36K type [Calditerrivibrio nitroreducens DSM 19672]
MKIIKFLFKFLIILLIAGFVGRAVYLLNYKTPVINKKMIVLLDLEGIILESDTLIEKLKKYEKDSNVVGVILRINSPGGAVAPSQEIYRFIKRMSKPVYASMSTVAASGGYYVASACDRIYAMPGTITGSIGVIMKFTDLSKIYDKIGVRTETIKSGKFKDIGSTTRSMTEEEKSILKQSVDDVYNQFIEDILSKRTFLNKEELLKYADGRIITGREAKNLKLVDKLGSYEDAYEDMKKDKNTLDAELFIPKDEKTFLRKLIEETRSTIKEVKALNGPLYLMEY